MPYIDLNNMTKNPSLFKNNGDGFLAKAYYENENLVDYANNYGFVDWASDAARDYYRNLQKGQMQTAQDIMISSKLNIDDSQKLLELYDALDQTSEDAQVDAILNEINGTLERMRKNGSWSELDDPNREQLAELIKRNLKDYDDNYKSYQYDLKELNESINNYDISQYYTRKSNDATSGWGNFFYKLPATMGTSNSSIAYQVGSMVAGYVGFELGAAAGTFVGGPVGTVVGGVAGGLLSLIGSQVAGGMQARENESHMEAFNAYSEKVSKLANERNVDLSAVANNAKQQLIKKGVDVSNLNQHELIQAALADKDIISGSSEFDEIAKEAFLGTRRVYEQNNALGAGEVLSDLSYFVPVGKYINTGLKAVGKAAAGTARKAINPVMKGLGKRAQTGIEVANMGAKLRNKVILDKLGNFVTGSAWRSMIEGSEEGAQNVIVKKYMNDEYADDYANASLIDAITDGQLGEDLVDNLWLRAKTLGAAFGLNHEYKNDQLLFEEMMSGALLPFFSPQTVTVAAMNTAGTLLSNTKTMQKAANSNNVVLRGIYNQMANNAFNQITNSKKVGDMLADALLLQDEINRNTTFFKNLREGLPKGTYSDLIDRVGDIMKGKRVDGSYKYNLDNTVLSADGQPITDDDIDDFINTQRLEYNTRISHKKRSSEQLKSLGLDPEDEDLLLSLSFNARQESNRATNIRLRSSLLDATSLYELSTQENFREAVNKELGVDKLTDEQYMKIAQFIKNNQVLDYYDRLMDDAILDNEIKAALTETKISKYTGLVDAANGLAQILNERRVKSEANNKLRKQLADEIDAYNPESNILDLRMLDEDQVGNMLKSARREGILNVINPLLLEKSDKLESTDKTYIQQQLAKYREGQHIQHKLADAANEAARTQEEVKEVEDTKPVDNTKVTELSTEAVTDQLNTATTEINNAVNSLNNILASIPENSYLHALVDEVNKGRELVGDDPVTYARYVKNVMNRLAKSYKKKAETDIATDEDKANLNNLVSIAENIDNQLTRLTDLVNEEKARAQRINPGFPVDSTIWFDPEGNKYSFDFANSTYSENEGLQLTMNQLIDVEDDVQTKEAIDKLQKQRDKVAAENNPDNDRLLNSIDKLIDTIKKSEADKKTRSTVISANDPFLDTLVTRNNLGEERQLSNKIKRLNSKVTELIDERKKSRLRKKNIVGVDGDTFEFNLDNENGKKHGPIHQQDLIEKSKDRPLMIKGYPLADDQGAKIASMLENPYYAAKFWHGFITSPYESSEEAKKVISKKYAIVEKFGKKLNRYKAVDDFNKIGRQIARLKEKKEATDKIIEDLTKLANGEVEEIKVGSAKLTKEDYDNIVYALPVRIYFNQKRVGKKWVYVVGADFTGAGYTTVPSQAEIDSRAELVHNLWYNYKSTKEKSKETEGLEADGSDEKEYMNRVYFGNGDMIVTSNSYNFQITSLKNPNLNIYQNDEGEPMSNKEINEHYANKIANAVSDITPVLDDFVKLLESLGYSIDVKTLNEPLDAEHSDITKLAHLLTGIAKYGDGLLDVHQTLIPTYISKTIGQSSLKSSKIKKDNVNRAKQILQFVESVSPELFISYKNYQDDNNLTPSVGETVQNGLRERWFNAKDGIKILVDGEEISTENTEDNVKALTTIGNTFEKLLRESRTANDFLGSLNDLGYTFTKNGNKEEANAVLTEYFNNRRFSKLITPTNIMLAITMGEAEPLNKVNYENFNRILKHEQSKLNKIDALGLIKGENGQYVYSLDDWMKRNAEDEESKEARKSEIEVRLEELEKERDELIDSFNKFRTKEEVLKFIIDNKQLFTADEYNDLVRINRKGEPVLINKLGTTKAFVRGILTDQYDKKFKNLRTLLDKEVEKEITTETEFAGKKTKSVRFAYGSYDSESGSSIIYFNDKGEKVPVENVNGTPGAIYLVVPSFLNSSRRQTVVHLNPKHFDTTMATFLATVLKNVADGKIGLDSSILLNDFEGFEVDTDMTVKLLLDNFIYTGTGAIANNPSDNNYQRLLYVDSNGVRFGEQYLNDSNFDQLVNFIMTKKNYRIDREKLMGNAILGNNLSIKQGDNILYNHTADEIYTSILIDDGIVLTDLNRTSNSIMQGPSVYVNYYKKVTFVSSAQRAQNTGTAANAKQKLSEELNRDELQHEVENSETVNGGIRKYLENFVKGFRERVAKFAVENNLKPGAYKIGFWGMNSKEVVKTYKATIASDPDTGDLSLSINDSLKFKAQLGRCVTDHTNHQLVLLDSEGEIIKTDNGSLFFGKGFKDVKFSEGTKDSGKVSSGTSSEMSLLAEAVASLTNTVNKLIGGGVAPAGVPAATALTNSQGAPVGYNGLNTPSEKSTDIPVNNGDGSKKQVVFEEAPDADYKFTVEGNTGTYEKDGYTIKLPLNTTKAAIGLEFDKQDPDGFVTDDMIDEAFEVFNNANQQASNNETPQTEGGIPGLNLRPNPLSQFTQGTTEKQSEQPKKSTIAIPTYKQLIEFLSKSKDKDTRDLVNRINKFAKADDRESLNSAKILIRSALAIYATNSKLFKTRSEAFSDASLMEAADNMAKQLVSFGKVNTGAIFEFLDENVQKEDYDTALERVTTILGKDFDFSFLPEGKQVWDKVRQALIYVFGECAASGIRLYRDAKLNKIARGSFYHEAFHRISLFVLTKEQRAKMYDDARGKDIKMMFASDLEIEEYLADKFADFVLDSQQYHPDKYYEGNIFYRVFQRIADTIRNIIRKLSSKNITPGYRGLDKLFKDMYSGRYAYAKATKNNIEEFEKIYGKAPVYSGFKSNGITLAEDAILYNEILRDMLGKLIYNSGIYTRTDGSIVINVNSLKASYESDIITYTKALKALDTQFRGNNLGTGLNRFSDENVAVAQAKMVNLINVYKNIVRPEAWKEWSKIISKFVEDLFNITRIDSNNPNKILQTDIENDLEIDPDTGENTLQVNVDVLGFSEYRDSYMRNLYNSVDASMKMLLWSITDLKPSDVNTAKYTPDGLLKFTNVKELYTRIIHAISGSESVREMLDKLQVAAEQQMQNEDSATLMQVYEILSHPNTNAALVNKFFTDFVKYVHNFETHSYETIADNIGEAGESRYSATTKNGSVEEIKGKLSNKWRSDITAALDNITNQLSGESKASDRRGLLTNMRKPLKDALIKLNVSNIESIKDVLREALKLYSFGAITGDLDRDAFIWLKAMQNAQKAGKMGVSLLKDPLTKLNNANVSEFNISETGKKRSLGVYAKLEEMFKEKGILTDLSQRFGNYVNTLPSTQSQKGPKNTKIYAIGQYNFITKTFSVLTKSKEWLSKMLRNAYNFHSTWLASIKSNAESVKVHTKLSTVLDNEFDDSVADKEVTEFEDLLNRYVTVWSGRHVTPALANKRFAADIEGIPMMESVIDSNGNISKKTIDTFVGYIADEILAISDAMYTRQYFIDSLNKILKTKYTIDSFSDLTGLEQEKIFKSNPEAAKLLRLLVKTYHYTSTNTLFLYDEKNDRIVERAFHIDLRTGKGYKFRHYGKLMSNFKFTKQLVEQLSANVFSTDSRDSSKTASYNLANTATIRNGVVNMLFDNISVAISKFNSLNGIIYDSTTNSISNRYLPENAIKRYLYGKQAANISNIDSHDIYRAIGGATIQAMSDIAEFEKLCHGDVAYHKNIDAVTKRYSGIVSTTSLTSDESTMNNAFSEDRLSDAKTYNAVALNTTKVANKAKYKGEAKRSLGVAPEDVKIFVGPNDKGEVGIQVKIDTSNMLDSEGNIKSEYNNATLIKRFIQLRNEGRLKLMENGKPVNDARLIEIAVEDFKKRFAGYLSNDPTDAQSWMTAEMFRQLQQRKGAWNDVSEACYNLLTYYDKFGTSAFNKASMVSDILKMCQLLGIKYQDLIKKAEAYRKNPKGKEAKDYKGWILGIVDAHKFESPSLKYVYYGYDTGRMDGLTTPIYDKSSYKVLWKIEVEDHEMERLYKWMVDNEVDVIKQESATKSGGLPSFELYDENGNFDEAALNASIVQSQYFSLLGDQLNTASHHSNEASLLTQFMKIAMMNTSPDHKYRVNGKSVNGDWLHTAYKAVLDELTRRGFNKFNAEWGISNGTVDKKKFMLALQRMALTENLPAETIAAFSVDDNGEFNIHPAAMPNISWMMSRLLASMGDTIIDTTTPGKALYQVASLGYDNFLGLKTHSDTHLYMPGEIDEHGNVHTRMQVRLSINFFDDVIKLAKEQGVKGYDFNNFEDQKRFILENKELFALSYRVPTQGQNSTISIEIVDLVPSVQGSMIQFPAGITALTGSDRLSILSLNQYNIKHCVNCWNPKSLYQTISLMATSSQVLRTLYRV